MPGKTLIQELNADLMEFYGFEKPIASTITASFNKHQQIRLYMILRAERIAVSERDYDNRIWGPYWVWDYFIIEGISKLKSKVHKRFMLQKYLTEQEKLDLLVAFKFTEEYEWGKGGYRLNHLMRSDLMRDLEFQKHNLLNISPEKFSCISGTCFCREWIEESDLISKYFNQLVFILKSMRDSIAHDSNFMAVLPNYVAHNGVRPFSSSVIDVMGDKHLETFVNYECSIDPEKYFEITLNCRKRFLKQNFLR